MAGNFNGTPAAEQCEKEIRDRFTDHFWHIGQYNRRKIAGTSRWSQHSWANGLDIMVNVTNRKAYRATEAELAKGDEVHAFLDEHRVEFGIRYLIWRSDNHWNHIHVDFWPKGVGTPPLISTGRGSFEYSNGREAFGRIQEIAAEGPGLEKEGEDLAFSKGLSEEQIRELYQKGIAKGSSEDAVVNFLLNEADDELHEQASANMFVELARQEADGTVDPQARAEATRANTRLNKLHSV